ncbi:MAG TPA: 4-hydroxy-tetrahydrodipicolinate reductase [Rhizomicrobium sp.]|jgi:4-hydroxy-tetrahydrodipicolinate reductase
MADLLKLAIAGAAGRMGQAILRAAEADPAFTVIAQLTSRDDPLPAIAQAQALIDFTTPASSVALAALAAQARIVHVIGTTGLSASDEAKIRAAARHAVIVKSGNMSLGVNLLAALAEQAARALPGFDVEIVEMHHRKKLDAPSGTALLLGEAVSKGRNAKLQTRSGQGPREDGAIGFASLRGGTVIGEHDVIFAGPSERLVLRHVAEDRAIFAHGALAAAKWGQGQKPGLYAMRDVLGF